VEHSTCDIVCYAICANEEWNCSYATHANEGWNTVQCSFIIQYVQMRGGTQYNTLLCNLCRWSQTCANEGWNIVQYSFAMQLCRWGMEHSTMFICYATCVDEVDSCNGTQGAMSSYYGNQAFQANNWSWNVWVNWWYIACNNIIGRIEELGVQCQPSFAGQ